MNSKQDTSLSSLVINRYDSTCILLEMFQGSICGIFVDPCAQVWRTGKVDRPDGNVGSFPREMESLSDSHLSTSGQEPPLPCSV